jgi:hypothetical protein
VVVPQDFADMIEAKRLEDTGKREQPKSSTVPSLDVISEQEVDEVCTSHVRMLQQLTHADWLPRPPSSWTPSQACWDILKPVLLAYQVATTVGRQALDLFSKFVLGFTLPLLGKW